MKQPVCSSQHLCVQMLERMIILIFAESLCGGGAGERARI